MSSAKIIKTILFVCTGNTCRSPMAERIAKRWLATKFKVKECELEQKLGLRIGSGGLSQRPDAADDEEVRRNSSNPHNSPAGIFFFSLLVILFLLRPRDFSVSLILLTISRNCLGSRLAL